MHGSNDRVRLSRCPVCRLFTYQVSVCCYLPDKLQQHGERDSIRPIIIPEMEGDSAGSVIKRIAEEIDVHLTDEMIDRSHRMGRAGNTARIELTIDQVS